MKLDKKWQTVKAKILFIGEPYENFNGFWQAIELDVEHVKMKLYDRFCAIDKQWIGFECNWKLRNKGFNEGYPLSDVNKQKHEPAPEREKDLFRAKQRGTENGIHSRRHRNK